MICASEAKPRKSFIHGFITPSDHPLTWLADSEIASMPRAVTHNLHTGTTRPTPNPFIKKEVSMGQPRLMRTSNDQKRSFSDGIRREQKGNQKGDVGQLSATALDRQDRSWLPSELSIRCWKYEIYVKNLVTNQWIACVV